MPFKMNLHSSLSLLIQDVRPLVPLEQESAALETFVDIFYILILSSCHGQE